jgi:hypothetical protein
MTTRPEQFRVKAIECFIAAQKTQDPKTKETYGSKPPRMPPRRLMPNGFAR